MFLEEIQSVTKDEIFLNVPFGKHTTFRCGGTAKYYVEPSDEMSLISIVSVCQNNRVDYFLLGNGSKILVSDKGYNGVVISTKKLNKINFDGDYIYAQSGVTVAKLLSFCTLYGVGGFEFLAGIPATVGGLIATNGGAFGQSMSEVTYKYALYSDGKTSIKDLSNFAYRRSPVKSGDVVLFALLDRCRSDNVRQNIKEYLFKRNVQPIGNSAGSVFKNPSGDFAGRLIEQCGLKGYQIGGAEVSQKHANFIINNGGTSLDVYNLIQFIKRVVNEKFGITLEEEVRCVGDF